MTILIFTIHTLLALFTLIYGGFMFLYLRALRTTERQVGLSPPPSISTIVRICSIVIGANLIFNVVVSIALFAFSSFR